MLRQPTRLQAGLRLRAAHTALLASTSCTHAWCELQGFLDDDEGSPSLLSSSAGGNVPLLTHPPSREKLRVGRREQQATVARLRHPRKTQHQPTTDAASTDQAPGRPPSTSCATPRCSLRPPARTPGASCRVFWTMTKAHRACCRRQPVATCHC